MTDEEGNQYFQNMLQQILQFKPDAVIAVARSGFSYAQWVAQELRLPLGAFWPQEQELVIPKNCNRLVFVDDNVLQGSTYLRTKLLLRDPKYADLEWRWAVLFCDVNTDSLVREKIIYGGCLDHFAEEPFWGSRKISQSYGVRYRDE